MPLRTSHLTINRPVPSMSITLALRASNRFTSCCICMFCMMVIATNIDNLPEEH